MGSSFKSDFYMDISTKLPLKFKIGCFCPNIEGFLHCLVHIVSAKPFLGWILCHPVCQSSGLPS